MKEYKYDKELYMHGACQYFALAAKEIFGGTLCFWLDVDYDLDEDGVEVMCHTYLKIAPYLYLDAYGVFRDIRERENEFEYNEMNIIEDCTDAQAKEILKNLGIPSTNVELKRNVREYLRNNMLVLVVNYDGLPVEMGISLGYYDSRPQICKDIFCYASYCSKEKKFYSYSHFMTKEEASRKFVKSLGFKENKQWWYKK